MRPPGQAFAVALAVLMTTGMAAARAGGGRSRWRRGKAQCWRLPARRRATRCIWRRGPSPGDLVVALAGVTIEGEPGAVVLGSGTGDAIQVTAPDVTIRGLTIRGSGLSLIDKNSAGFP